MTYVEMLHKALAMAEADEKNNVFLNDAQIIAFLLDNCEVSFSQENTFFLTPNVGKNNTRIMRRITRARNDALKNEIVLQQDWQAKESYAYDAWSDFGHTNPGWENIFQLGLGGLRDRIANRTGEARNPDFVEAELLVLDAAERFCLRAADAAEAEGRERMAKGLRHLSANTPRDLYEAFQLALLFYSLQTLFEGTDVRTLGRLDQLVQPFADKETDKAWVQELADRFTDEIQFMRVSANMPYAIAGTDGEGRSQVCEMSYVLLKAYKKTKYPDVKLHILCTEDMPRDFLELCMESIKEGGNSLVFLNNRLVVDGLCKLGMNRSDAAAYAIVGCYEASGREEVPCSCAARLSIPKALECALHGGRDTLTGLQVGLPGSSDFETFDQLYEAFKANLTVFAENAMALSSRFEERYPQMHGSPLFSASLTSCVRNGGDAYCDFAADYNNSSLNVIGLATAADSLYAIRKVVYEDRQLTLPELVHILDTNWEGQEPLRLYMRNKLPKYGVGDSRVDSIAADISRTLSDCINGTPNGRGGVFRLGVLSIDWRKTWGVYTGASADGRCIGETMSQNASATFGMDKDGLTGHILSAAVIDGVDAVNGSVLDLEMHSSAVRGEHGTQALVASLETFLQAGGQTVHYNVLDTETLKDAQIHPENHANLQVRMCGWNVLFTHLSKASQDEFIARSCKGGY